VQKPGRANATHYDFFLNTLHKEGEDKDSLGGSKFQVPSFSLGNRQVTVAWSMVNGQW
jgi:hypothetical protein